MSCVICLEEVAVEPVACSHCSVAVCGGCLQQHLLNQDLVPICHSCKHPWTDDFVDEAVPAAFRNGALRDHKTKILVDQEIARLPELQDRARRYMLALKGRGHIIQDISRVVIEAVGAPVGARWLRDVRILEADMYFGDSGWRSDSVAAAPKPAVKVLRACPAASCRGFLSETGTCALCSITVCLKCMEKKAEDHECNPETVATVAMLVRETKPCPNCHAPISKIDGCDQMWCTQCQTAFSWKTGLKENGHVHNPHYYEWMRRTQGSVPRVDRPGAGGCADLRQPRWHYPGHHLLDSFDGEPEDKREFLTAIFRNAHRRLAEAQAYNRAPEPIQEDLNRLGIKYLAKELPQKEWARRVYLLKRRLARQSAIYEIKTAFFNAGRDIFNSWSDRTMKTMEALKQLTELQIFMDAALKRCHRRFFYTSSDTFIGEDWFGPVSSPAVLAKLRILMNDEEFDPDPELYQVTPEHYKTFVNNLIEA